MQTFWISRNRRREYKEGNLGFVGKNGRVK